MSEFNRSNGWKLYLHPVFQKVFDRLTDEVKKIQLSDTDNYQSHPKAKLLKRIIDLILVEIPADPSASQFLQGNTLGKSYRHWYRAKFFGRFRLFYRYSSSQKIIIYAWINDENTLRKSGSKSDPYIVFFKRLQKGKPPDRWEQLIEECQDKSDK